MKLNTGVLARIHPGLWLFLGLAGGAIGFFLDRFIDLNNAVEPATMGYIGAAIGVAVAIFAGRWRSAA